MTAWEERSLRATAVLLVTSFVLIGPSFAGIGGSLLLAAGFGGLALVLGFFREQLTGLPVIVGHDFGPYGKDLWLGVLLGAIVVGLRPGATPGELQAIGGLAGLVGMVNYFLRPVYLLSYALVRRASQKGRAN